MKAHDIKIYARSKEFPAHTFLQRFVIHARTERGAGRIARRKFRANHTAKIEHVEIGGVARFPGFGRKV